MSPKIAGQMAALFLIILGLAVHVSAHKFTLSASSIVPAAAGELNTDTDRNGNTKVEVKVEHLAKPGNLTPPAITYVVWFQQQDAAPESQGELRVDKNLKGLFRTTTPWKSFDVIITAESDPSVKNPSGQVVFRAKVQS